MLLSCWPIILKINHLFSVAQLLLTLMLISYASNSHGHAQRLDEKSDLVRFLGNSAVLVETGGAKILFDPFFHNNFGIYRLVPAKMHKAVMEGQPPYDDIDAIFISHAHEDHFSVRDVHRYLKQFPRVKLFAPQQAIQQIQNWNTGDTSVTPEQLISFSLDFGDQPELKTVGVFEVAATRIPHAGWPSRKDVQNIVFSVKVANGKAAMHMGDADPNDDHYLPYKAHWQEYPVDVNFPPYWFFTSAEGRDILNEILHVKQNIGVHVPMQLPNYLKQYNHKFLSEHGESIAIE